MGRPLMYVAVFLAVFRNGNSLLCSRCVRARGDQSVCENQQPDGSLSVTCGESQFCAADVKCDGNGRITWTKNCQSGSVTTMNKVFCREDNRRCFFYCNTTDYCNRVISAQIYENLPCYKAEQLIIELIDNKQDAFNSRDDVAFKSVYHPDAVVYPQNGAPVRGIDAIITRFKNLKKPGKKINSQVVDFAMMGDNFTTSGVCFLRTKADGTPRGYGKSLYVYILDQETGKWLIYRHMFNDSPNEVC